MEPFGRARGERRVGDPEDDLLRRVGNMEYEMVRVWSRLPGIGSKNGRYESKALSIIYRLVLLTLG